jgi:hypothetical protein
MLDRTFSISTLRKIFPEADFGTLFTKLTALNLLYGATYRGKRNLSKLLNFEIIIAKKKKKTKKNKMTHI